MTDDSTSMFAPLTTEEATSAPTAAPPLTWRPMLPVPEGVSRALPPHRLGRPSFKWPYRDDRGQLLFLVCRFDLADGGKDILPLTFCEGADGRGEWRWKGVPTPRPLYHLDQLAARPDAPVLICEGEKAADAAAGLFPDFVTTTSPNGAKAADKADWSPLVGRVVTVWPDHDDEGASYAADVSRLALMAGAALVAVVAVPDSFPIKWDLADTAPAGWDGDGLRGLLMEAPPVPRVEQSQEEPPPAWESMEDEREPVRILPLAWFHDILAVTSTADFVEGVLGDGQMSVTYGESNSGKTFFACDISLHVAFGWEWFGRQIESGGVIYVAAEGGLVRPPPPA
jgi:hypothetical protein